MAKIFYFKAIVITAIVFIVAVITVTTTAFPAQAKVDPTPPNSDGSCASGSFETRIGCCPNGTMNIHDTCSTAKAHKENSDKVLKCMFGKTIQKPSDIIGNSFNNIKDCGSSANSNGGDDSSNSADTDISGGRGK
jgi:hypothetical protein